MIFLGEYEEDVEIENRIRIFDYQGNEVVSFDEEGEG